MQYKQALEYLSRYTNYERELRYPYDGWAMNLERVRVLLDELGSPDKGLTVAHVAGTKGKGSTSAMIEAMARAAGKKTGLFTSPHLVDFRERIKISGKMVDESMVAKWVERIEPAAEKVHARKELGPLTYFEILTALAVAAFADAGVELAVLEAGLGGRYDATTACDSQVAVLTRVSLDHTDILGDTLTAIATEKSMIIKPGKPAVVAPQSAEALAVFEGRAREVKAPLVRVEERYSWETVKEDVTGQDLNISGAREMNDLFLPLAGRPQATNLATALSALDQLGPLGIVVSEDAVRRGLQNLKWPARFERVSRDPDIILDGAHNADSAKHLRETLERLYPGRKIIAVMGLGGDKDVEGFCRELGPALSRAILTRSKAMKAVPAERIEKAFADFNIPLRETKSVGEALEAARSEAGPDDVILVTGSFYLISEFLAPNAA